LATAQHGRVDQARQQSGENGQTPAKLAQHLLDAGIYDALLEKMEPLYVSPRPELGMDMDRVIMPIVVDREIHGYIWIIAGDPPLTQLDEMAIKHGATVAALILFKELAVLEAQEKQKGDFLDQLLRGEYETAHFSEQARQLGYRSSRPHQVILIEGLQEMKSADQPLVNEITNWFRKQRRFPLVARRDQYLVLILENGETAAGKKMAADLVESLNHPTLRLLVGLGNAYDGGDNGQNADGRNPIRQSYEEAEEAIRISQSMGVREGVVPFQELGLLHWLYHLPPEKQADNIYLSYIDTLNEYDSERDADLVKTLECYLEHGGALVETAKKLFIHRNTLLHRLERIESLTHIDLRHPLHRLNLYAAIKSYRLQTGQQGNRYG
jgi:purine catabolism regulator